MANESGAALFTIREAANYLGVGKSYFEKHVRQLLPVVDLSRPGAKRPMPRIARADLDEYIAARTRKRIA